MCGYQGGAWLLGGECDCKGGVCRARRDMVNEQAVRILLECILVRHDVTAIILADS